MEQTLEVAHVLFAARGFAAVTMDDIAAEVGVTKPLLYNYFGNKERLYVACMERAGDALFATIEETVRPSANPGDAAQRRAARLLRLPRRRPRRLGGPLRRDPAAERRVVADRVADYRGRLLELVAESLLAQLPPRRRDAASTEVEALSTALMGAAEALARWWLRTEAVSAQEAAELLISTIEPGLRARSSPKSKSKGDRS